MRLLRLFMSASVTARRNEHAFRAPDAAMPPRRDADVYARAQFQHGARRFIMPMLLYASRQEVREVIVPAA